jgi:hypothetical protein
MMPADPEEEIGPVELPLRGGAQQDVMIARLDERQRALITTLTRIETGVDGMNDNLLLLTTQVNHQNSANDARLILVEGRTSALEVINKEASAIVIRQDTKADAKRLAVMGMALTICTTVVFLVANTATHLIWP